MSCIALPRGVRSIELGVPIGARRNEPVVVVPVFGAPDLFRQCLSSLLAHTSTDVPILIADDASPGPEITRLIDELNERTDVEHRISVLRQPRNLGFVENVNTTLDAASPGDVVVVNSDCIVGPQWLDRLRAAAYSDTNVATATALTNQGTILTLAEWSRTNTGPPTPELVDSLATEIADISARLRPRIPTAIGHCFYIRRDALDLVGVFDPAFSPGYGEEVDFSQRCVLQGLSHVAADDVFVYHAGKGSFGQTSVQEEHERMLLDRYPHYHRGVQEMEQSDVGPLARSLATASRALRGVSATIDARCLGPTVTGTQVHVLELTAALWRTGRVQLRVIVPPDVGDWALQALESLNDVEILRFDQISDETPRSQLIHRPYQIFHVSDLPTLARLGERIVITHQDMIAYRNPGYARSPADWIELHRLTRLTLGFADSVLFFSDHARQDTLAEGLIDPARSWVVHLGVDHRTFQPGGEEARPSEFPFPEGEDFLLCLGTNFRHKNRVFAMKLLGELQSRHGWPGWLVFAGPHAAMGTSEQEEGAFLAGNPEVRARTIDLEHVSEAEKKWLFRSTAGVLHPSVYEGFGLVPFEAAAAGVPCFFAWTTALTETLPPSTATLVPWDAAASADQVAAVLATPEARRALTHAIQAAGSRLRWDRTAVEVLEAYRATLEQPPRELVIALDGTAKVWDLTPTGIDALARLGLPRESYRALLAILARPALQRIFFLLLRAFFRLGYFARHGRLPTD
jgi:glycosyltransferase involved in cell wall biosynthesis/GT2 family glycosyltransferase